MKKRLTIIAFALTGLVSFAQQDAQFSMYMFNRLAVNPGYAGMNEALCGTFLYRNQWTGFTGNPKTGLLALDYGKIAHGGVGLVIDQDQLGFEKTFAAKAAYSYHQTIGTGVLGIGLEAGMLSKSLSGDFIAPDGTTTDQAIPWTGSSKTTYDIGLGLYFKNERLYAGLSCLHIPGSAEKFTESSTATPPFDYTYEMARHYYIMAGYTFPLGPDFTLTPSAFIKSDASATQYDINAMAEWKQMVFLGVSYRTTDAIPIIAGVRFPGLKGTFKLGYSYDVLLSSMKDYSSGSNELMLGYCYKITKPTRRVGHENQLHLSN